MSSWPRYSRGSFDAAATPLPSRRCRVLRTVPRSQVSAPVARRRASSSTRSASGSTAKLPIRPRTPRVSRGSGPGGKTRGRVRRSAAMVRVQLYAKPGSPACEDARDALARLRHELGFEWSEVDVTADPAARRFESEVPVLFVDGRAVLWGEVDAADARKHIAAAVRAARAGAAPASAAAPAPSPARARAVRLAVAAGIAALVLAAAGVWAWQRAGAPARERALAEQVFG